MVVCPIAGMYPRDWMRAETSPPANSTPTTSSAGVRSRNILILPPKGYFLSTLLRQPSWSESSHFERASGTRCFCNTPVESVAGPSSLANFF